MFEILVGLAALAILYRMLPKSDKTGDESSILPFLDEEFRNDDSKSKNDYYDWDDNLKDEFHSADDNDIDDSVDDYFEQ